MWNVIKAKHLTFQTKVYFPNWSIEFHISEFCSWKPAGLYDIWSGPDKKADPG